MSDLGQHENQVTIIQACRACLDTKSTNFYQFESEDGSFSELYQFCIGLSVTIDGGSHILCNKCVDLIKHYAEFKKQCHKSEEFWCSLQLQSGDMKCNSNKINIKIENREIQIIQNNDHMDSLRYYSKGNTEENYSIKAESVDRDIDALGENMFDGDDAFMTDDGVNLVIKKKKSRNTDKWKCANCHREYKNKKRLLSHIETCDSPCKTTQAKSEMLYCGLCEFESNRELMKQHLEDHAVCNDMNCRFCDFVGKDFASMVSHRYCHQPQEIKPKLYCHLCDAPMRSCTILQYHYRTEHLNKSGLECTLCKKTFKTYKCWRNHDRWHRVDKYICDICGKKPQGHFYKSESTSFHKRRPLLRRKLKETQQFLFRNAIEAHMIDHAEFNKYICETCGRGFKRHFNLKCHVLNRHTAHAPVKCSHCNRMFKSEFTLQNHLRLVNKEKPYGCPVCTKKFPSEVTLKNHLFWHSDERPFSCEICGSKYKAKSQLKIHMRQHTGIMPFKCQQCDKSFASSNQLKVHSSVHTGIRRHKCNYCHRTFHGRKLVEAHCAAQHKDKQIKIDIHV